MAELLSGWGARPLLQAAGLCHACYGTDGFPRPLLEPSERSTLADLIGSDAEGLVYLYGSCDRGALYPHLRDRGPVPFRDRFTGETFFPEEADLRAFVELTAANELDVLAHNPELAATHGKALFALMSSARQRLSDAGWDAWCERFGPAAAVEDSNG